MQAGGVGLSSGLYYAPGSYSKTAEVVAMAKATAPFGGVYSSHIRDEADYTIGVVAAVDEVITIAEQAGVVGVVSHMPKGVWRRHTVNGWTSNALVPDTLTDLGGGAW